MSSISAVGSIGWYGSPQLTIAAPAALPLPPVPPPLPPSPMPAAPPVPPSGRWLGDESQPPPREAPSKSSREVEIVAGARRMRFSLQETGQRPRAPFGPAEGGVGDAHRVEDGDEQVVVRQALAVVGQVAARTQGAARAPRQHVGRADAAVRVALRQLVAPQDQRPVEQRPA